MSKSAGCGTIRIISEQAPVAAAVNHSRVLTWVQMLLTNAFSRPDYLKFAFFVASILIRDEERRVWELGTHSNFSIFASMRIAQTIRK